MKKLNITEVAYNKLKEKILNEISYGMVDRAYERSNDLFTRLHSSFLDFYDELMYPEHLSDEDTENYEKNPYIIKIKEYAEAILDILDKKNRQQDKFYDETMNKFDRNKFYDSEESKENDYDEMDLRYLQSEYPKN